jgi:hypothetical protein
LTISDLFIARDTILKLKDAIDTGEPIKSMINGGVVPLPPTEMNVGKPVKTTEKQMRLIVALLKRLGLTDSDLKGSITQLRNKANKGEELPLPDDDKTLIDWLRKGESTDNGIMKIPGSFLIIPIHYNRLFPSYP